MKSERTDAVDATAIREWTHAVFRAAGLADADALVVAACLVDNSLRGLDGHGLGRVPIYVDRLRSGAVNPHPRFVVDRTAPGTARFDGDNGQGVLVATRAMQECIAFAKDAGAAFVAVHHANHFAAAGQYAIAAAASGMIGMVFCNSEANMPPWGSLTPYFGTNPIALAVPATRLPHVVLDIATSETSWGRIQQAAFRGETIPEGWATDHDGNPITDAARAAAEGLMVPMSGHKGSGLAMMVDVFAGVLAGASYGTQLGNQYKDLTVPQNLGFLMGAIDVSRFGDRDQFLSRVDDMIDEIHRGTPAVPGGRIYVPGEIEEERRKEREVNGIPLADAVYAALSEVGTSLSLPMPDVLRTPAASDEA